MTDLIMEGDEALTPEEYAARVHRRAWERDYRRARYHTDPEYRARAIRYVAEYRWRKRQASGTVLRAVASLHSFRCTGPTKPTGCRCRKTVIYEPVR